MKFRIRLGKSAKSDATLLMKLRTRLGKSATSDATLLMKLRTRLGKSAKSDATLLNEVENTPRLLLISTILQTSKFINNVVSIVEVIVVYFIRAINMKTFINSKFGNSPTIKSNKQVLTMQRKTSKKTLEGTCQENLNKSDHQC